MIAIERQ